MKKERLLNEDVIIYYYLLRSDIEKTENSRRTCVAQTGTMFKSHQLLSRQFVQSTNEEPTSLHGPEPPTAISPVSDASRRSTDT